MRFFTLICIAFISYKEKTRQKWYNITRNYGGDLMDQQRKQEIISNIIYDSQYITKVRLERFIKESYDINEKGDCYKFISEKIAENLDDLILKLQEYEYNKSYKYFSLYTFEKDIDIEERISSLFKNKKANVDTFDYWSKDLEKPTIRTYENDIDLKFNLILSNGEITIKYTVIATLFKDENLISIKFYSINEELYQNEFYIDINNKVKSWIESNLQISLTEFDSMKVYKSLYKNIKHQPDEYENESIHSILMDDEMNGRSYFRASDTEVLPFLGKLIELANSFESNNDKERLLGFINRYEDEAIVRSVAIKWKHKFKNSNGKKGSITVGINKLYSVNNSDGNLKYAYTLHHIRQDKGVNRERINYVIRYISRYLG